MQGMTIYLSIKTQTGTDGFGAPIYTEELKAVDDCLVGQPSVDDISNTLALYGKKISYRYNIK